MYAVRLCTVALLAAGSLRAQTTGEQDLAAAYQLLTQKNYDSAIAAFQRGLAVQPKNAAARKDLAYTLLKAGETADARDQFEKALILNPHDDTAALEYAFLCYDTRKPIEARRTFDRLRTHGLTASTRITAQKGFENIDAPLRDGIARWQHALAISPNPLAITTYSAHWELAQLAEQRDELQLAAEQYEICRRLKPRLDSLLVDLARVWQQLNDAESAHAALLAASRCSEPRTAENALELLGPRYPYVYEFQNAIKLDPQNIPLRRELAYLLLALHKEPEAVAEFEKILAIDPHDQLSAEQLSVLRHPLKSEVHAQPASRSDARIDPKIMGRKSLAAGYINDAIRYFRIAHENNPDDADVMLQLGWAYNLAKNDKEALQWFDAARHSSNTVAATEANRAWHNLRGDGGPQTTTWALPMYSSRWKDAFVYGQIKHNLPFFSGSPVHLYLSTRFIGDARGQVSLGNLGPQYLSESEFIVGGGVSTKQWHHLLGWAEAGEAMKYLSGRHDVGAAVPDYRGGLNFAKAFGSLLGAHSPGPFYETTGDAVYVSRFDKDWLFYSQHRIGRTFHALGGNYFQIYANGNYVRDVKAQYWANSIEFGPGTKIHLPWLPPNVYFAADWLRGVYTNNKGNPRGPNYTDLRLSFWYAVSR
jgi:tetratricopeptide (TPR) repeat protein